MVRLFLRALVDLWCYEGHGALDLRVRLPRRHRRAKVEELDHLVIYEAHVLRLQISVCDAAAVAERHRGRHLELQPARHGRCEAAAHSLLRAEEGVAANMLHANADVVRPVQDPAEADDVVVLYAPKDLHLMPNARDISDGYNAPFLDNLDGLHLLRLRVDRTVDVAEGAVTQNFRKLQLADLRAVADGRWQVQIHAREAFIDMLDRLPKHALWRVRLFRPRLCLHR
mmetsp:Transcript_21167/g.53012  ORF Transcript_21167/g.53012 Transcript_21167/m.53012 type:complete len:227 (-) Transcript_21167:1030-1710(-)